MEFTYPSAHSSTRVHSSIQSHSFINPLLTSHCTSHDASDSLRASVTLGQVNDHAYLTSSTPQGGAKPTESADLLHLRCRS